MSMNIKFYFNLFIFIQWNYSDKSFGARKNSEVLIMLDAGRLD